MKIYAIRNDYINDKEILCYLLYFENSKTFYVELIEEIEVNALPIIFGHFREKDKVTIDSYWSKRWVSERIVPRDRQNIAQILRANKLNEYDEFELLKIANGRCAQDDNFITEVTDIPEVVKERQYYKVEDIILFDNLDLLIMFSDKSVRRININCLSKFNDRLTSLFNHNELLNDINVLPGGYGIQFANGVTIADYDLYTASKVIDITYDEIKMFVKTKILNTSEVIEKLDCSRQNVNDLIKREKLTPIKSNFKSTLFINSDIIKRMW